MAVMWQSRSEGRSIIEGKLRFALWLAQLLLEGVNLVPVLQHFLLFGREVWLVRHYEERSQEISMRMYGEGKGVVSGWILAD